MKLLRQIIRQLILEGETKDAFEEAWYNVDGDSERSQFPLDHHESGTMHKDQLKDTVVNPGTRVMAPITAEMVDELFEDKRDLKRIWNNIIDAHELRSFWEGPKMKYYHSLSYYGSPAKGLDKLQVAQTEDELLQDLSAHGFFQKYNKSGNKDEMSAYGIYEGFEQIPRFQKNFGVMISGRVTLALMEDAFTESRSKASLKDLEIHASSGLPKRIMPTDEMIASLLFEEVDITEYGKIGECIIDNWSIDAIVCNTRMKPELVEAGELLAKRFGVPFLTPEKAFKKG